MMKPKGILRRLGAALAAAFMLCGCAQAEDVPQLLEPVGAVMDTVEAWVGELSELAAYDASVVPYVEELSFVQEGTVETVHVVIGQKVSAGDVLITLNREAEQEKIESLRLQIERLQTNAAYEDELAQIDLEILRWELRRLMEASPRDDSAVALKKLDVEAFQLERSYSQKLRLMELQRLEAELSALETEVGKSELYAPFDGRITHMVTLERGSFVSAYTPVIYLADDTRLFVESDFLSASVLGRAYSLQAQIGAEVYDITHVPMDNQEYISKTLAGEKVMTQFEIDAPEGAVSAGQYAAVIMEVQHVEDALMVPSNALFSDAAGRYLYVMENGARVRRSVKTGAVTDWHTQILEGLEEGEVVYVKE